MTATTAAAPHPPLSAAARRTPEQPIARLMAEALARPGLISLAAGFVDTATLPLSPVGTATFELLEDATEGRRALQYGSTPGDDRLRATIVRRYYPDYEADLASRIVLTAGSNQLLHLAADVLLDPGDVILCASPTYFVYLGTLDSLGARTVGVATDAAGIDPEAVARTLAELDAQGVGQRVKAIYVVPDFDNPAGTTMPADRRRQLIDLLRRRRAAGRPMVLLADYAYRELRFEGRDEPTFLELGAPEALTVEAGTFSKSFAPGIRVGWGLLPEWMFGPVCHRKAVMDFGSAHFNQRLVDHLIGSGGLDEHLARLRPVYREKRDAMLAACDAHLAALPGVRWQRPAGGLYVWLELPESIDAGAAGPLWEAAAERGVLYVPGAYGYAPEGEPTGHHTIRLSYGVQTPERIAEGVRLLGEAIRSVLR